MKNEMLRCVVDCNDAWLLRSTRNSAPGIEIRSVMEREHDGARA